MKQINKINAGGRGRGRRRPKHREQRSLDVFTIF